jgi:hypothetical protein
VGFPVAGPSQESIAAGATDASRATNAIVMMIENGFFLIGGIPPL